MTKYRVVERGKEIFVVQIRYCFIWFSILHTYYSIESAKKRIRQLSYVEKVVYETEV